MVNDIIRHISRREVYEVNEVYKVNEVHNINVYERLHYCLLFSQLIRTSQ